MRDETAKGDVEALELPGKEVEDRVVDALDLTLVASVVSDLQLKARPGGETAKSLEKIERTLWGLYRNLTRHRDVALLEPEFCAAAENALRQSRQVHRDAVVSLVGLIRKRRST